VKHGVGERLHSATRLRLNVGSWHIRILCFSER
jgi:hypothetical protein